MSKLSLLCAVALVGVTGCATTFNDSAPATPGSRYFVGSRANEATVFLCPEKKGTDCEIVDVDIKD